MARIANNSFRCKSGKVQLLGFNGTVKSSVKAGKLIITPPALSPAKNPCDYAWVYKIENVL